jgi:hypothetical protein
MVGWLIARNLEGLFATMGGLSDLKIRAADAHRPAEVLRVSTMASFHLGTFSKLARKAKTSSRGRRMVTEFSNSIM